MNVKPLNREISESGMKKWFSIGFRNDTPGRTDILFFMSETNFPELDWLVLKAYLVNLSLFPIFFLFI